MKQFSLSPVTARRLVARHFFRCSNFPNTEGQYLFTQVFHFCHESFTSYERGLAITISGSRLECKEKPSKLSSDWLDLL